MKLSTRIRYGLRAIIDLYSNYDGSPVLVKDVAARQQISKKYLENLLISLKNAGLVRSIRGAKGGYIAVKSPNEITVEDVMVALEGPISFVECDSDPSFCDEQADCVTKRIWTEARSAFVSVMRSYTLADLIDE